MSLIKLPHWKAIRTLVSTGADIILVLSTAFTLLQAGLSQLPTKELSNRDVSTLNDHALVEHSDYALVLGILLTQPAADPSELSI